VPAPVLGFLSDSQSRKFVAAVVVGVVAVPLDFMELHTVVGGQLKDPFPEVNVLNSFFAAVFQLFAVQRFSHPSFMALTR